MESNCQSSKAGDAHSLQPTHYFQVSKFTRKQGQWCRMFTVARYTVKEMKAKSHRREMNKLSPRTQIQKKSFCQAHAREKRMQDFVHRAFRQFPFFLACLPHSPVGTNAHFAHIPDQCKHFFSTPRHLSNGERERKKKNTTTHNCTNYSKYKLILFKCSYTLHAT